MIELTCGHYLAKAELFNVIIYHSMQFYLDKSEGYK